MSVQQAAGYLGAVYTIATALATVLPPKWALTRFLAAAAADLRGIHWAA